MFLLEPRLLRFSDGVRVAREPGALDGVTRLAEPLVQLAGGPGALNSAELGTDFNTDFELSVVRLGLGPDEYIARLRTVRYRRGGVTRAAPTEGRLSKGRIGGADILPIVVSHFWYGYRYHYCDLEQEGSNRAGGWTSGQPNNDEVLKWPRTNFRQVVNGVYNTA